MNPETSAGFGWTRLAPARLTRGAAFGCQSRATLALGSQGPAVEKGDGGFPT